MVISTIHLGAGNCAGDSGPDEGDLRRIGVVMRADAISDVLAFLGSVEYPTELVTVVVASNVLTVEHPVPLANCVLVTGDIPEDDAVLLAMAERELAHAMGIRHWYLAEQ